MFSPGPLRLRFGLVFLSIALAGLSAAAVESPPSSFHALWTAESDGLHQRSPADGSVWWSTLHEDPVRAVAVDLAHLRVWAFSGAELRGYDFTGASIAEHRIGGPSPANVLLAVDPADGSVWIGVRRDLWHVSATGTRLHELRLDRAVRDLAVDPTASRLWVATAKSVFAVDTATGLIGSEFDFGPKAGVGAVAVTVDGGLWVAVDGFVRRIENGTVATEVALDGVSHLTAARDGALWAVSRRRALRVDPVSGAGEPAAVAVGGSPVHSVAVDPTNSALWAVTSDRVIQVAVDGTLRVMERDGERRIWSLAVSADVVPPTVTLIAPVDESLLAIARPEIRVAFSDVGSGVDGSTLAATMNGLPLDLDCTPGTGGATCRPLTDFPEGGVSLEVRVTDLAGNLSAPAQVDLVVDTVPPPAADLDRITVSVPEGGVVTVTGEPGSVEAVVEVVVGNLDRGSEARVAASAGGAFVATLEGASGDGLEIVSQDAAGNVSPAVAVEVPGDSGPGDGGAAALDPTVPTDPYESTRFLYEGDAPVQEGVAPGTIDPQRVAVLRGTVAERGGAPLAGVEVRIHGHPELGLTRTRDDGEFDLVVNGGGPLVLSYSKKGYIGAQRVVETPWRDFAWADPVVLLTYDPAVTVSQSSHAEVQVARGSQVSDKDGTRRATIIIPGGTAATLELPGGGVRTLDELSVRATEFTVGLEGPEAMPGPLPFASGYTYAVELSADEAVAAGARHVRFSQPVYLYVENFLGFPVGSLVPVGWYDAASARWEALDNGRVIRVLTSDGGRASVDVDGSGGAADAATLAALGFTDGELWRLAEMYPMGETLWRTAIPHFSPFDLNWPYGPPEDAVAPPDPDGAEPDPDEDPDDYPDEDEDKPCERSGSIIECENQTLGERLAVVGTPYTLNYRSDRVPGRRVVYEFPLRLSGPEVPTSLKRIELVIDVAGRRFVESFAPAANLRYTFTWDGLDAYGRTVVGAVRATARVAFVYPLTYLEPGPYVRTFSRFSDSGQVVLGRTRREVRVWTGSIERSLGLFQAVGQGLGGWTLSAHHTLDVDSGTLHFGDGSQLSNRSIATGYAMQGSLVEIDKLVEWMPDGTIYGVEHLPSEDWIWELRPDGSTRLRHTTDYRRIRGLAVTEDGTIYYTTTSCSSDRPGFLRRVKAGALYWMPAEDLATWPEVKCPQGLELNPDGSLLIFAQDRLLSLSPSGELTLVREGVRGGGGTTATTVRAPDGSIYVSEPTDARVRRIGRDGSFSVVAGTGVRGFSGDGGPATQAQLSTPTGLAIDRLGRLLIADSGNHRIRRVGADGVIETIIGNGDSYPVMPDAEGTPALAATLHNPRDMAVGADGTLYIKSSDQVVRVRAPILPLRELSYLVAGRNGRELYAFNASGRHLRTLHSQTNATLLEFEYDAAGLLTAIVDADGERTVVEREADGRPRALVAPSGARTRMHVDGTGYLDRLVRPDGSAFAFEYRGGGLLTRIDLPGERFQTFDYSAAGRLVKDVGPAGNASRISRRPAARRFEVDYVSAMGRTTTYGLTRHSGGGTDRTVVSSAGLLSLFRDFGNGSTLRLDPDGTTVSGRTTPDPRFGADVPLLAERKIALPSGLTFRSERQRSVQLYTLSNPLSLRRQTDTLTDNGRTFTRIYESVGRRTTSISPEGRRWVGRMFSDGRPRQEEADGLATVDFSYDDSGRLAGLTRTADGEVRQTLLGYGDDGFLALVEDPLGRTGELGYDPAGRPLWQVLPDGQVVGFGYDAAGRLASVTPPGRSVYRFGHADDGRLLSYDPASAPEASDQTLFSYNRDRQLTGIVQPSGHSVALTYATSGRLRDLVIPEGSYHYDFSGTTGNMSSIRAPDGGVVSLEYDGFLHTASTWSGAVGGRVERGYDVNFWVDSILVNGVEVDYAHDRDGLLTRAGDLSLTRHPDHGSITATQLGRVSTQLAYDGFGDMQSLVAAVDGVERFVEEVERDAAGRIIEKRERVDGVDVIYGYSYDLRGRLESVTREGAPWMSYGYDANGNRLRQVSGGVETSAVYDERDRLLSSAGRTFVHGVDGDLQSMSEGGFTVTYDHDVLGHLRGATLDDGRRIEYLLDAANRRIGKRIDGVLVQGFLYDGALRPIAELDGANNVVGRFVYAGRAHVPDYVIRPDGTYRIVSDHLGSPRLVVNVTSGEVVQRMDYDPFGVVTLDAGTLVQPFGFAGGLYDRHTGLVHFGNREYDPRQGRWTTIDPILFAGRDTNLYAYVGSDPVNFIDPLGWEKFPADPSGLSEEWVEDPTHKDPNGTRFRRPNGDYIDYHRAQPGERGEKAKDHWHHNKQDDKTHYKPGDEIPEGQPEAPSEGPSELCLIDDPVASPIPPWVGITAGVGLIAATLAQDIATGGLGLLDDPATLAIGVGLILGTSTSSENPDSGGTL